MKKEFKKLLRPAVFTLGGALAGLGYYALVGCSTGSCAITASPVNTMHQNGKAVDSITAPGSKAEIDRFIQGALAK